MHSFSAVLHNTAGLKPGYLPQPEATALLSRAIHMLTLSSYLEGRVAKLKKEALGRVLIVLAGSPPKLFVSTLRILLWI